MKRLINIFRLAVVLSISLGLLIFIGLGEARRTYPRFAIEKLAAQGELVQTAMKPFLLADLPLNQYLLFFSETGLAGGLAFVFFLAALIWRQKPGAVRFMLAGLAFAENYGLILAAAFVFVFFLMSAYPVGFQYGAEVSYPAPEATSQGLMVWAGQVSGILFILGMDAFRAGPEAPMTGSMVAFIVMTAVVIVMALFLRESAMIRREAAQDRPGPSSADRP